MSHAWTESRRHGLAAGDLAASSRSLYLWEEVSYDAFAAWSGAAPHNVPLAWWIMAISAVLVGNTLIAVGLLLQKRSHHKEKSGGKRDQCCHETANAYFLSLEWFSGLLVFLLGHGCCWLGLAVGTQMVMSCLNCWCIVVTIILAPILFGEAVSVYKIMAVSLLIVGCVWVILTGPRRYRVFTVDRLHMYLDNKAFLALCCITLLVSLVFASSAALTKRRPRCSALQLAVGAAMCAWYSVLAAKCVAGLQFASWQYHNFQQGHWQAWAACAFLVIAAAANLHLLNLALAAGDAVTVMPVYEAASLVGQIVLGGVFFQEFDGLDAWGHLQFWCGVGCVLSGVVMASRGEPRIPALQRHVLGPGSRPTAAMQAASCDSESCRGCAAMCAGSAASP